MKRREFIALLGGTTVTWPLAALAQQPKQLYLIGMLERTSPAINAANLEGFRQGLRELGYVEGKTFVIDYRSVDGRDERYPGLATELVRLKVDLILTRGTAATLAAKNATGTIPVVITGIGDPVGQGIVTSLARPGRECDGAEPLRNGVIPETNPAAQGTGSQSRTNRSPRKHGYRVHPTCVESDRDGGAIPRYRAPAP